jgi:CheY-like chemotaxis protein
MTQEIVLVVDDNPDNREIFATALAARGYAVLLAKNGADAIRVATEGSPDAVLMDIHMPVMNGIEATVALKAHPDFARLPILAVSAYDVHEPELRHAGFCAFLPKPVEPAFLVHAVRTCIDTVGGGASWVRVGPMDSSP